MHMGKIKRTTTHCKLGFVLKNTTETNLLSTFCNEHKSGNEDSETMTTKAHGFGAMTRTQTNGTVAALSTPR